MEPKYTKSWIEVASSSQSRRFSERGCQGRRDAVAAIIISERFISRGTGVPGRGKRARLAAKVESIEVAASTGRLKRLCRPCATRLTYASPLNNCGSFAQIIPGFPRGAK